MKKLLLLLVALVVQVTAMSNVASATDFKYLPGLGMAEIYSNTAEEPHQVDNSGLFGMTVDEFRAMCIDTDGAWDVVNGRHVCYCNDNGEFNYPYGCPSGGLMGQMPDGTTYYPEDQTPQTDPYPQDQNYDNQTNPYAPQAWNGDAPMYWDLYGHWSEDYVIQLTMMGIVQGYPDGSFRPNEPITRAEMLKMTMMAAGVYPIAGDEDRNKFFTDLDSWQAPWVNAAYRLDIVEGYSGPYSGVRLYKPNNNVNRAEGVKLVLASFGRLPLDFEKISYTDVKGWMIPWVEDAFQIGLVGGEANRRFRPTDQLTRGEAAKIIVKMLEYSGDI